VTAALKLTPPPAQADKRRPLLAQLHIAKKALALTDDSYRDVLRRITGQESGKDCTERQLRAMLDEFKRLGWANKAKPRGKRVSDNPQVRKIYAVWADLAPFVAGHGPEGLRTFCRRQTGVDAPEFLDPAGANKVVEGLKAWLGRMQRQAATQGEQ
jgi:hypothetical protein